jgi:mannose-6-phosphate isomerase-like protein (cupin superfamily)
MLSGDSIIIHKNEEHRLENASNESLEIIEIQTGTYFGEDDIIRLKDSYGRAGLH